MTAREFATAIGIVESNGNIHVSLGDADRAMGRFQMHPDWWDTWQPKSGIRAVIGNTWDKWQQEVLEWFFTVHTKTTIVSRLLSLLRLKTIIADPVVLAMYYHLGHIAKPTDADWDVNYANKFKKAAGLL